MKLNQSHRAKMARRRTITVLVGTILLITIIVVVVNAIRNHSAEKAALEAQQAAEAARTSVGTVSTPEEKTAADLLSNMTLEDKILQMMLVTPEELMETSTAVTSAEDMRSALNVYQVGGVVLSEQNLETTEQVTQMIQQMQSYSATPMFVAIAEEGGYYGRAAEALGITNIKTAYSYAESSNPDSVLDDMTAVSEDLKALGFNLNLAPVANVSAGDDDFSIRCYSGTNYETAANLSALAVQGIRAGGLGSVVKYFPGVGNEEGVITKSLVELEEQDEMVFKKALNAGASMLMVGHSVVSALGVTTPASLTSSVVQDMVRTGLGYDGVVITDALTDEAITDQYSVGNAAVAAIVVGNDMIYCPGDISKALTAVRNAVESGTVTEERINESVTRILNLKISLGIIDVTE